MFHLLLVATGGATGALLRFGLSNLLKLYIHNSFYATLCINVIGSFFIAFGEDEVSNRTRRCNLSTALLVQSFGLGRPSEFRNEFHKSGFEMSL